VGATGPQGNAGIQGVNGVTGPTGPTGPTGANSPHQNVFPANGSGAAPLSGSITIADGDTREVFFIAATDTSTNGQSVTLPTAVAGKAIWIIGNYTAAGNVFSIFTQGSDLIFQPTGSSGTSDLQIGFFVHLVAGSNHDWHVVLVQ
jgi:hypothetical protein